MATNGSSCVQCQWREKGKRERERAWLPQSMSVGGVADALLQALEYIREELWSSFQTKWYDAGQAGRAEYLQVMSDPQIAGVGGRAASVPRCCSPQYFQQLV